MSQSSESDELNKQSSGNQENRDIIDMGIGHEISALDPVVQEPLAKLEREQGHTFGTIVDIASFNISQPYDNFDVKEERFLGESKQRVQKIIDEETYNDCILLAVAINTNNDKDVFIHPFTYESSNNETHQSIVDLCESLNVGSSMLHHLIGETVLIQREKNVWEIAHHKEDQTPRPPTVNVRDFVGPMLLGLLSIPLGFLAGWRTNISVLPDGMSFLQTDMDVLLTTGLGFILGILITIFTLWIYLAGKRDYPLPNFLGKLQRPSYLTDENVIENDSIVDVEHVEVIKLTTVADESEYDNERVVLHNLALVGRIPHVGKVTIPIPCPRGSWHGSLAKHSIYRLAPTIAEIDNTAGDLFPVTLNDQREIKIQRSIKMSEPPDIEYRTEEIADLFVETMNWLFRTPTRDDVYGVDELTIEQDDKESSMENGETVNEQSEDGSSLTE